MTAGSEEKLKLGFKSSEQEIVEEDPLEMLAKERREERYGYGMKVRNGNFNLDEFKKGVTERRREYKSKGT